MVEVLRAPVPVPVDVERADAVFNEPLDLPVDDLGIRLVVPAENGLALGTRPPHARPGGCLVPPGKVERREVVVRLHRLRLRHIGGFREIEGGPHRNGYRHRVRRHVPPAHLETRRERPRRRARQHDLERRRPAALHVLHEARGLRVDPHPRRQGNRLHAHRPRAFRPQVRHLNRQRNRRSHAVEGVGRARARHHEVGRQRRLFPHEREVADLPDVRRRLQAHEPDLPRPRAAVRQIEEEAVRPAVARHAHLFPLHAAFAIARPLHLDRRIRLRRERERHAHILRGRDGNRVRSLGDLQRLDLEDAPVRRRGGEIEPQAADALLALPVRTQTVLVPRAVTVPREGAGELLRRPLPRLHPEELALPRAVPPRAEDNFLRRLRGEVERGAVEVRVAAAADDLQPPVPDNGLLHLVSAPRPRAQCLAAPRRIGEKGTHDRADGGHHECRFLHGPSLAKPPAEGKSGEDGGGRVSAPASIPQRWVKCKLGGTRLSRPRPPAARPTSPPTPQKNNAARETARRRLQRA